MNKNIINELKIIAAKHTECNDFEQTNPQGNKMMKTGERVFTRQLIMYYLKKNSRMTLADIGLIFTIPVDHATVLHAVKVLDNYLQTDKKIAHLIEAFFYEADEHIYPLAEEKVCIEQIESYFLI